METFECNSMCDESVPDLPDCLFESVFESLASGAWRELFVVILSFDEILTGSGQIDQLSAHPLRACTLFQN